MDMGLKIDPRSSTRAANAPAHLLWVSKNLLQCLIPTDMRRDAMRSPIRELAKNLQALKKKKKSCTANKMHTVIP